MNGARRGRTVALRRAKYRPVLRPQNDTVLTVMSEEPCMSKHRVPTKAIAGFLALAFASAGVSAEDVYPSRPVRIGLLCGGRANRRGRAHPGC